MKSVFILAHDTARRRAVACVSDAPAGFVVTVQEPKRTNDQNATQWPILAAFANQLQWPVNGALVSMDPDDWKDLLSAAFRRERVRLAQGLDGGVVMLGMRTSKMSKETFSEWLNFLNATAALRGVVVHEYEAAC